MFHIQGTSRQGSRDCTTRVFAKYIIGDSNCLSAANFIIGGNDEEFVTLSELQSRFAKNIAHNVDISVGTERPPMPDENIRESLFEAIEEWGLPLFIRYRRKSYDEVFHYAVLVEK